MAGTARIGPLPDLTNIDVTLALTDSFDVVPGGKCAGRHIFQGVRDGATVEARGLSRLRPFVESTVTTRYEANNLVRAPGDDGKFCVVTFRFGPVQPDSVGYYVEFPLGPGRGYGYSTQLLQGGVGLGPYYFTVQSCTDYDAPPERPC